MQNTDQTCQPVDLLHQKAKHYGLDIMEMSFAKTMDNEDPLRHFRQEFHYPKMKDLPFTDPHLISPEDDSVYFCGNSLGLEPKLVRECVEKELDKWSKWGVHGHEHEMHKDGDLPWAHCDEYLIPLMAPLVGAKPDEIGIMNGLSVNIHFLFVSFYRPSPSRFKILLESKAFPSDHYIVESQLKFHGYDPADAMICMQPRSGEDNLRTEDIISLIEKEGDRIALIFFSGVQYYTGQLFDIQTITQAGHKKSCIVGWDLAHAVGNIPLHLHDWEVDFAAWCTYKYLNSGAGNIAGLFIHEKHCNNSYPKLLGWWGHKHKTRFEMTNKMELSSGPNGYRVSNPSGVMCACLLASLKVFKQTNMEAIRSKSLLLTAYLELLLKFHFPYPPPKEGNTYIKIITPSDPSQRGAQLSVMFSVPIKEVKRELEKRAVVCDEREPNVLRVAPVVLYNNFSDVHKFVQLLEDSLNVVKKA